MGFPLFFEFLDYARNLKGRKFTVHIFLLALSLWAILDIAHEQLAQTLAKQGGLGVARLVVEGLERKP